MFTQVRSANRRVSPVEDNKHKVVIKAVYVVLEPQYQNSLTEAAKSINKMNGPIGIDLSGYLIEELRNDNIKPVLVDFTHPDSVYENTRSAIAYGVSPVVGTTGLSPSQIQDLSVFAQKASVGCAIIPNFSVGMVLLQQAASVAARFYDNIELIEMHHNQKADSPSGTCIKTAEMIEEYPKKFNQNLIKESESLKGVRGGIRDSGINIHSVRLPGLLAHQLVIMGSPGETYTIKHDTIDRKAYMPGVLQAIKKIGNYETLVYGLEKLIF